MSVKSLIKATASLPQLLIIWSSLESSGVTDGQNKDADSFCGISGFFQTTTSSGFFSGFEKRSEEFIYLVCGSGLISSNPASVGSRDTVTGTRLLGSVGEVELFVALRLAIPVQDLTDTVLGLLAALSQSHVHLCHLTVLLHTLLQLLAAVLGEQ